VERVIPVRALIGGALLAAVAAAGALADDVAEGRSLYETECAYCHFSAELPLHGRGDTPLKPIPVMLATYGPKLVGIVGRAAGSDPAFNYSESFLAHTRGLVWTRSNLDRLMTDSRAMIPGTRMFYRQPDAEIRRKLLAYLETTG
jgi:cytochrome c2